MARTKQVTCPSGLTGEMRALSGKEGNLLANRSAQRDGHHLNELEQHLPEDWFIHPNGFIAAYGTPKSPMDPSESGISVEELNQVVQTWIGGWSE